MSKRGNSASSSIKPMARLASSAVCRRRLGSRRPGNAGRRREASHLAGSGQEFSDVAAAQDCSWKRSPESLFLNRKAEGFELRDHFQKAIGPASRRNSMASRSGGSESRMK